MKRLVSSVLNLWAKQHKADLSENDESDLQTSWRLVPPSAPNNGDLIISLQTQKNPSPSPHPLDVVIANELGWVESFSVSFDELENILDTALKILQSEKWQSDPPL